MHDDMDHRFLDAELKQATQTGGTVYILPGVWYPNKLPHLPLVLVANGDTTVFSIHLTTTDSEVGVAGRPHKGEG